MLTKIQTQQFASSAYSMRSVHSSSLWRESFAADDANEKKHLWKKTVFILIFCWYGHTTFGQAANEDLLSVIQTRYLVKKKKAVVEQYMQLDNNQSNAILATVWCVWPVQQAGTCPWSGWSSWTIMQKHITSWMTKQPCRSPTKNYYKWYGLRQIPQTIPEKIHEDHLAERTQLNSFSWNFISERCPGPLSSMRYPL